MNFKDLPNETQLNRIRDFQFAFMESDLPMFSTEFHDCYNYEASSGTKPPFLDICTSNPSTHPTYKPALEIYKCILRESARRINNVLPNTKSLYDRQILASELGKIYKFFDDDKQKTKEELTKKLTDIIEDMQCYIAFSDNVSKSQYFYFTQSFFANIKLDDSGEVLLTKMIDDLTAQLEKLRSQSFKHNQSRF